MSWTTPIFDRVLLDITNKTSKAYLNVLDWIRIYRNSLNVNAFVNAIFGTSTVMGEIAEPTITTIPDVADLITLTQNIEDVRLATRMPANATTGLAVLNTAWIGGANAVAPDYEDVNDWEKNLSLLRDYTRNIANNRIYCGVASVGQSRLWQHRFRQYQTWVQPAATPVRRPRLDATICGADLTRNNLFRRYA
jgi:uncharacterized membrane protein